MDPNYYIDEPNRVAEVYRNYRPTVVPFEVERRLDFIDISEEGYAIVGSSNLSGRYWRGSVWYFKNATLAPRKESCDTGIECEATVSEGKFIDGRKTIIVGEDSGAVSVFELIEDDQSVSFEGKNSRHDHDSCVLSISVSSDKSSAVTAGMDLCIKVWDIDELVPAHTYRCAHSHHITNVAYSTDTTSSVFASCGLDGAALLWDTRQTKPATVIVDDPKEGLTALTWQSGDSNTLIVGSAFGAISLLDVRTCSVSRQSCPFNRSIYKLLSIEPSSLAACADSHEVKVMDPLTEDLKVRYVDEKHTDFVRGLSYDTQSRTLYSCGWDKQVIPHDIKP
uniref:Uncharacterized protein n=1 Tax=Graphocephala atropunctata TaxID=36148 RepID=A0A1B6KX50_9HEMI